MAHRYLAFALQGIVLSSVVAACERRGKLESSTCDVNEAGINDSTIGPLHIDEAVPALRVRCPAVSDTLVAAAGSAGGAPALRLIVVGAPVIIRHDGTKVTELHVTSPFFRTNDSLGPGTSVAKFRNRPGIRVSQAVGAPFAVLLDRRRCGVAYELSGWFGGSATPVADSESLVRGAALAAWPDSIVVRAVTVSGCRGVTRDIGVDSVSEALADSALPPVDTSPDMPLPSELPRLPAAAPAAARADTGSISATPRELADLSAKLAVPVQGVTAAQLRDTYAETRGGRLHEALDIPAGRGAAVIAATDGRVLKLFNSKPGGLMVYTTDASARFILLYGHLDRYATALREGMPLERGQVIGYVGTTGNAPIGTPHLHFAILRGRPSVSWWSGTPVNPYFLLVPGSRGGP
ncbi:MAG: M23 family metallopeptidase [Gemmatimonadaceae bacterium]